MARRGSLEAARQYKRDGATGMLRQMCVRRVQKDEELIKKIKRMGLEEKGENRREEGGGRGSAGAVLWRGSKELRCALSARHCLNGVPSSPQSTYASFALGSSSDCS